MSFFVVYNIFELTSDSKIFISILYWGKYRSFGHNLEFSKTKIKLNTKLITQYLYAKNMEYKL